jgi:threonine aldolase
MKTRSNTAAWLAAGTMAAAAGLLAACDNSAQPADGAVGEREVGTAAYTPDNQVVPTTGTNAGKLDAPEIVAAPAPTEGAPAPEAK